MVGRFYYIYYLGIVQFVGIFFQECLVGKKNVSIFAA